ncbi:DUF4254 domain-containing protein [Deferribacter thermophilus]|uniref:DUF4254 domain-containing protein n=1 Tax=Deferribacter thermophilus TaxID=53573 RepID=UPI003C232CFC
MESLKNVGEFAYNLICKWHEDDDYMPNLNDDKLNLLVLQLTRYNYDLWHEEDKARDPDATDSIIANVKRKIDKLNQSRNDTIEKLDEEILNNLKDVKLLENAKMNSETPGSIIDRITINALKIYHMDEQTKREDASREHIEKCKYRLLILKDQAKDLQQCLNELMDDLLSGRKFMKVYRQMKMYNDPNLNPVLYKKNKK